MAKNSISKSLNSDPPVTQTLVDFNLSIVALMSVIYTSLHLCSASHLALVVDNLWHILNVVWIDTQTEHAEMLSVMPLRQWTFVSYCLAAEPMSTYGALAHSEG